ncbi:replication initiator protein A [Novosphingobium profundi]|uniref:replication initiator protein A n=1 Tax=Novosphingobium profundi TaxID=1774954 RepID=UPI001BDAA37F|nr:replication initiator protein A [Novosphingobium profundi]MBT0671594.1 replication initiator protein A [Novosphingobium profundi]
MSKTKSDTTQVDLFLPQLTALPIRDQRETMERPFFSLSKRKRLIPIDYESPDRKVTVFVSGNSRYGIATIYDLDILIYCASVLIEYKRQGRNDIPQTLNIVPYDLLRTIRRKTGGKDYEQLSEALDRLQSTTVKTNIRADEGVDSTFSWIDSYSQLKDAKGKIRGMRITLAKWFYDGVMMEGGVLAIDPAYFEMTGGRERWLYRVARKHAGGNNQDGFAISLPTLFEKSGAEGAYRRFKFEILKIVKRNDLPGYALEVEPRPNAEPMLRMIRRDKTDSNDAIPCPPSSTPTRTQAAKAKPATEAPLVFPADGHIAFTDFGPIASAHLPSPQRDRGLVAQDFRDFLKKRDIARDDPKIVQIFTTFCKKQKPAI